MKKKINFFLRSKLFKIHVVIFFLLSIGLISIFLQKTDKINKTSSSQETDFSLSIFENLKEGYKFAYPEGFQIKNIGNDIEVSSSSGKGKIIVQITDKSIKTKIIEADFIPDEITILQNAEEIIKNTFTFKGQKYSEKELQERFSSPSSNSRN